MSESPSPPLRFRDAPPVVRRLFVGIALSALGSGLTLPLLFVYLSQARGIPVVDVGILMGGMGVASMVVAPAAGTLTDRFGPRAVLVGGLVLICVGLVVLAAASTYPLAVLAVALVASGNATSHPAGTALLSRLVHPHQRTTAFGWQFMLLNAGLGSGGLIGSSLVQLGDVGSFQRLYVIDALGYAAFIGVLATLPRGIGRVPVGEPEAGATGLGDPGDGVGGWREVLRDRAMLRYVGVSVLLLTFGYAQIETGFAAYVVEVAGQGPRVLGWAFAANTAVIVAGQLVALRLIRGRRRTTMLSVCAATWAVAWSVVALSAWTPGPWAAVCVVVGLGLFGAGETLLAPTSPALVNDLAPEALRGRYNALAALVWTVAAIVGPALAGFLIGTGRAGWWVATTVGGVLLASLLFLRLRHHLDDRADGLSALGSAATDLGRAAPAAGEAPALGRPA